MIYLLLFRVCQYFDQFAVEGRDDKIIKRMGQEFSTDDIAEFLKDFKSVKEAYVFVHHRGYILKFYKKNCLLRLSRVVENIFYFI
jgi:hypothetical protein